MARLLPFPNVMMTSHQRFLTVEALEIIANAMLDNAHTFVSGTESLNEVK